MSTRKNHKEILEAVQKLLDPHGGTCRIEQLRPRAYPKFIICIAGKEYQSPIAISPRSTNVAIQHKINDTRRLLRELKLI